VLQQVEADVAKGFEDYRLDNVANTIYDFVWNEFCDWYLEIAKVQIQTGSERPAARHPPHPDPHAGNHPAAGAPGDSVHHRRAVAEGGAGGRPAGRVGQHRALPAKPAAKIDEAAIAYVVKLKALVDACRNLRGEMNVSPATRLPLFVMGDPGRSFMKQCGPVLQALAKLNEVRVFQDEAAWSTAAQAAPGGRGGRGPPLPAHGDRCGRRETARWARKWRAWKVRSPRPTQARTKPLWPRPLLP
jgi:valyl-tRNA synthetase